MEISTSENTLDNVYDAQFYCHELVIKESLSLNLAPNSQLGEIISEEVFLFF